MERRAITVVRRSVLRPKDLDPIDKMEELIQNGYLPDCEFIVGPDEETAVTIPGHKMLFIMESPVFATMFSGNYVEARDSRIRITDVNPYVFKIFRLMIYNKCNIDFAKLFSEDLINLYRLCHKYMATTFLNVCIAHMKSTDFLKRIEVAKNFITVFEFFFDLEDKSPLECIKKAITDELVPIYIDKPELNMLSVDAFYEYLHAISGRSDIREADLFSAIESYCKHHNLEDVLINKDEHNDTNSNNETISILKKLLKLINFGQMTLMEFQKGPGNSKLLNVQQKYNIITKLIVKYHCKHQIHRTSCKNSYCNQVPKIDIKLFK